MVSSLVKQRKDSIEQFTRRAADPWTRRRPNPRLGRILPPSADPATIERAVLDAIAETAATSAKDKGRVMKTVMAKRASVDGKAVNEPSAEAGRKLNRQHQSIGMQLARPPA